MKYIVLHAFAFGDKDALPGDILEVDPNDGRNWHTLETQKFVARYTESGEPQPPTWLEEKATLEQEILDLKAKLEQGAIGFDQLLEETQKLREMSLDAPAEEEVSPSSELTSEEAAPSSETKPTPKTKAK